MKIHPNDMAFPTLDKLRGRNYGGDVPGDFEATSIGGLTKRELFAAMAMQGFITSTFTDTGGQAVVFTGVDGKTKSATPEVIAQNSIKYADALITELNKQTVDAVTGKPTSEPEHHSDDPISIMCHEALKPFRDLECDCGLGNQGHVGKHLSGCPRGEK